MNLYVASPLGFSEAGRHFLQERLHPLLESQGHRILDPWASPRQADIDAASALPFGQAQRDAWRALSPLIAADNAAAIRAADQVLAVLDGPDVDSGVAAEIGYAAALGKRIIGYRGDFRPAGDNVGATVNLQVEYFIRAGGGVIVLALDEIAAALAG
ncbi:MAG: nucleoside 2-deoxyribosyltransferase [Caulobacteraceae bacterium]|nr:nucleoside 2-deoxyribosyltransferase [Caulobacteraceae bacterium]